MSVQPIYLLSCLLLVFIVLNDKKGIHYVCPCQESNGELASKLDLVRDRIVEVLLSPTNDLSLSNTLKWTVREVRITPPRTGRRKATSETATLHAQKKLKAKGCDLDFVPTPSDSLGAVCGDTVSAGHEHFPAVGVLCGQSQQHSSSVSDVSLANLSLSTSKKVGTQHHCLISSAEQVHSGEEDVMDRETIGVQGSIVGGHETGTSDMLIEESDGGETAIEEVSGDALI